MLQHVHSKDQNIAESLFCCFFLGDRMCQIGQAGCWSASSCGITDDVCKHVLSIDLYLFLLMIIFKDFNPLVWNIEGRISVRDLIF